MMGSGGGSPVSDMDKLLSLAQVLNDPKRLDNLRQDLADREQKAREAEKKASDKESEVKKREDNVSSRESFLSQKETDIYTKEEQLTSLTEKLSLWQKDLSGRETGLVEHIQEFDKTQTTVKDNLNKEILDLSRQKQDFQNLVTKTTQELNKTRDDLDIREKRIAAERTILDAKINNISQVLATNVVGR